MSILCGLGRHRPGPRPRWNDGYYFTTCTRCGRDLVRTPYERWKVPLGYRVVWSHEPPEKRVSAKLAAEPDAARESPAGATEAFVSQAPDTGEPDLAPRRSIFPWAGAQPPVPDPTASAADLSIGEVLRILREEEALALEASPASEAGDEETETLVLVTAVTEFDAAEPAVESEPLELEIGQMEPEALAAEPVEPTPAYPAEGGTLADELQLLPAEQPAEHETPAEDSGDALPADAGHAPDSPPFDDFMDEPDPADASDFWIAPPASETAADQALDAVSEAVAQQEEDDEAAVDEAPDGLLVEEPLAVAAVSEDTLDALDDPLMMDSGPVVVARTEDESWDDAEQVPEQAAPEIDGDQRRSWPSAAPTQVHTPIIGLGQPYRARNRARSRMGVRIAIAGLAALAMALIVTRVSGFETAEPAANSGGGPVALAAMAKNEQFNASRAYVATGVLDCHPSPAASTPALRTLPRGAPVRVLAREFGWASIAYEGRQCWVADRYLSAERPL